MSKIVHSVKDFFCQVKTPNQLPHLSSDPYIFKVSIKEMTEFKTFCQSNHLSILDTIDRQLEDLVRIQNPGLSDKKERDILVQKQLSNKVNLAQTTNWVFFPWQQQVFHILNEADYFSVITNRNKYKINEAEQALLQQKTIGVVGLSVGGEAAITVAQEHLCSTIKIADFDELDLSNLNRLNAGLDEIGILKTIISARRIYRINPYLKVIPFHDGIHTENMDQFMDGLDLLIEECDGLDIKFPIREAAKAKKINTIYCADERGLLSIEPYGNDPNFPIIHGMLKAPQPSRETYSNDAEFLKALAIWCGGWELISERSRASLSAIGKTTCGYPQLASEARFAAGQLGHVARRLLLGEEIAPFFKHIDLEELIR